MLDCLRISPEFPATRRPRLLNLDYTSGVVRPGSPPSVEDRRLIEEAFEAGESVQCESYLDLIKRNF